MKLITYTEAANILGLSVDTLYQALEPKRSVFTKAGRKGTNGLLIEDQVRLFLGENPRTGKRKRLSLDALSSEEQAQWKQYALEFERQGARVSEPGLELLVQRAAQEGMEKGIRLGAMQVASLLQVELQELFKRFNPLQQGDIPENFPMPSALAMMKPNKY